MLFYGTANAAWDKAGRLESATAYIDISSIKKVNNIVTMKHLFDNDKAKIVSGQQVWSDVSISEYNCDTKMYRTIGFSLYSERMGEGKKLYQSDKRKDWEQVIGFNEWAWKVACGYIRKN
jgi:hypothetical protein